MPRKAQTLKEVVLSKTEELRFHIYLKPDSRDRSESLELATEAVEVTRILVEEYKKQENLIDQLQRHIRFSGVLTPEIRLLIESRFRSR